MAKQLATGCSFNLSQLDGRLIAWRKADAQPHLIEIEGQPFVAIFDDERALDAVMTSLGITGYTVKMIEEGHDFIASLAEAGVKACFNVYRVGERLRYTEVRLEWQPT